MFIECCTPSENIMLLSCSGGSNVGQLANQAAIELTQEGFGGNFLFGRNRSPFGRLCPPPGEDNGLRK